MHIHDILKTADYRMAQGRDWIWDFLGRDCREIMFESYGPPAADEHFPVSAVFHCATGEVRMLTVEYGDAKPALRWMHPDVHDAYVHACGLADQEPWKEPFMTWISDPLEIMREIRPALHPDRRASDDDLSYMYESKDVQMLTEMDHLPVSSAIINPT